MKSPLCAALVEEDIFFLQNLILAGRRDEMSSGFSMQHHAEEMFIHLTLTNITIISCKCFHRQYVILYKDAI